MSNQAPMDEITERWYLSGAPWFNEADSGALIYSGSPDPHVGKLVADVMHDIFWEDIHDYEKECEVRTGRRFLAQHIVELHNKSLKTKEPS